nr:WYL domain-containing protein [uncultured Amphritea sp.]
MSQLSIIDIPQAQKERLSFIEFRLYFYGEINRSDLVSRFGIKEAAASRDISVYKEIAHENIAYDAKGKSYILCADFKPVFDYSDSQTTAALLYGFGDDFIGKQNSVISCESPTQLNYPNIATLAPITRAIYKKQAVKIVYLSLSSGLSEREIVPFALVNNGLRWHVRAFDRTHNRFADFVVNRIKSIEVINIDIPKEQTKSADNQWNRIVDLHIVPHPSIKYPEVIEKEYSMSNGVLIIQVRAAVAGYVLRHWNIDCSVFHTLTGPENYLWLKNRPTLYGVENLTIAPGYADQNIKDDMEAKC